MKNVSKKIGFIGLMVFASSLALAQSWSYKGLAQELQLLQKQLVPDKRVAILNVELKDTLQSIVTVSGETNLPEAKAQIAKYLQSKEIHFVDSIRLLPDALLGDHTWALATLSVSNIRALPDHASELVSQAVMGTPMKVLDVKENWYRVQTPDYYIGWMDASGLHLLTQGELVQWKGSNRYIYTKLYGNVVDAPKKKADVVSDLVLGDLFEVVASEKGFLKIKFPDGRTGYVHKKHCQSFGVWSQTEPKAQTILSIAKKMMGSPYLWGGTSSKGIDCSGFVKVAYFSQGVIVARDASQQARYGNPIDINHINNLQQGDLLFFGRSAQHITHVGMYMENGYFIHSSGKVHVSSIVPSDPKYVPTRHNVAACRVLNALNTEGITKVKDHPWYTVQP